MRGAYAGARSKPSSHADQLTLICSAMPQVEARTETDFRNGSSTDLTAPKSNFRSSPESGLKSDIAPCPKSANRRHHTAWLDRLIGAASTSGQPTEDCDRETAVGSSNLSCC